MIKVLAAQKDHINYITPKEVYRANPYLKDEFLAHFDTTQAVTFVINGVIVAIVGVQRINASTSELWAITSEEVKKHPVHFHRKVEGLIEAYANLSKIKRLQMLVRSDFNEGIKWAEKLQFGKEGLMKKYGSDGHDYVLFGRVF